MKYIIDEQILLDIANAIREKTGKREKLLPTQMANEIKSITTQKEIITNEEQ